MEQRPSNSILKDEYLEEKIHEEMPYIPSPYSMYDSRDITRDYMYARGDLKHHFNEMGMFAFVSWKWIKPFAEWINGRKCLEVMAGRGWLSHGLQELEVNIIATDDFSWHEIPRFHQWKDTKTDIEKLNSVDAVNKYGNDIDIVIMSWPYMDSNAYDTIKALYKVNPNAIVVYIGETWGGCTADDDFFAHFKIIEDESFQIIADRYEQWDGAHDFPMIGKYIEGDNEEDEENEI